MKKNKSIIVGALVTAVLLIAATVIWLVLKNRDKVSDSDKLVYVTKLGDLTGASMSFNTKYMGVVEPQETKAVQKDDDKKVKEIFVKEGDYVKVGTALFSYDTEQMELDLESKQLEIDNLSNSISGEYDTIEDLKNQRNEASGDVALSFTSQINTISVQIKQDEYDLSVKKLQLERLKKSSGNSVVTSPMEGVIKKINNTDSNSGMGGYDGIGYGYGGYGSSDSSSDGFITIMATGAYRVKGTATEENIMNFSEGTSVVVSSRTDPDKKWSGVVSKVDKEATQDQGGDYYYYGGGGGESSSKYNFYIELENADGLMLGQHLYVELGDNAVSLDPEKIYVPAYYLIMTEEGATETDASGKFYVWKKDGKGRIRKTAITVGNFIPEYFFYEVTDGLSKDDYLAFPDKFIEEGMNTTTNYEEAYFEDNMSDDGGSNGEDNSFTDENGNTYYFDDEGNVFDENGNKMQFDNNGNIVPASSTDASGPSQGEFTEDGSFGGEAKEGAPEIGNDQDELSGQSGSESEGE